MGLLFAVYAEVVKGHTLWHLYTANNVKIAIWLQETDRQMVQLRYCTCLGALERVFRFHFTCLGARNANGTNTVVKT